MQFLTVSLAALSLSANVIASPVSLFHKVGKGSVVATIEADIKATPIIGHAVARLEKKEVEFSINKHGADVTLDKKDTVASATTAVEVQVSQKASSVIAILGGAVSSLKTSVEADLTKLSSLIASDVTTTIAPQIKATLTHLVLSIHTTTQTLASAVKCTVQDFEASEAAGITAALSDVEDVISSVEATMKTLVSALEADALVMVKPEISAFVSLISPFATPVVNFATTLLHTVTSADVDSAAVEGAVADVTGALGSLLSPVTGLLRAVL